MHVAFAADDKYAQHMAVAIASLLRNLRDDVKPDIFVIDGGISDDSKRKIASLNAMRDFTITYLDIDPHLFDGFPLTEQYRSVTIYYRLALHLLLPHLDKVLYLDTDIVVDDDLSALWETPLAADQWLGAVYEPDVNVPFVTTIGLDADSPYFNSGVLLLNLKALRQVDFLEKCRIYAQKYIATIRYPDQDVLNVVCRHHTLALPPRYNLVGAFTDKAHCSHTIICPYATEVVDQAIKRPAIIHYLGKRKPWMYICYHPYASRYLHYLQQTPWRDYRFPDKNIRTIISRFLHQRRKRKRLGVMAPEH